MSVRTRAAGNAAAQRATRTLVFAAYDEAKALNEMPNAAFLQLRQAVLKTDITPTSATDWVAGKELLEKIAELEVAGAPLVLPGEAPVETMALNPAGGELVLSTAAFSALERIWRKRKATLTFAFARVVIDIDRILTDAAAPDEKPTVAAVEG